MILASSSPPHATPRPARAGDVGRPWRRRWVLPVLLGLLYALGLPDVPAAKDVPGTFGEQTPAPMATPGAAQADGARPVLAVAIRTQRGGWQPEVGAAAGGPGGDPIVAVRLLSPAHLRYILLPGDVWRAEGEAAAIPPEALGAVGFAARSGLPLRYRVYSHEAGWSQWSAYGAVAGWPAQGHLLRGLEVQFTGRLPQPRDPLPPPRHRPGGPPRR